MLHGILDKILSNSQLIASLALIAAAVTGAAADMVVGSMKNDKHPYRSKIYKIILAIVGKMDKR